MNKRVIAIITCLLCTFLFTGTAFAVVAPSTQKGITNYSTNYGNSGVITSVAFDQEADTITVSFRESMNPGTFGMGLNCAKTWTKAWSEDCTRLVISDIDLSASANPVLIISMMQTAAAKKDICEPNIFVMNDNASPAITSVSVSTPTIVEGLAANLVISAKGVNLGSQTLTAYLSVDGELLDYVDITSGQATMKISAAPAVGADCKIVVKSSDGLVRSCNLIIAAYNPASLWNPILRVDNDGNVNVVFSDEVGTKTGYKASVGGAACGCEQIGSNVLKLDVADEDVEVGTAVVISGVKYPVLFPSYSFTFTIVKA